MSIFIIYFTQTKRQILKWLGLDAGCSQHRDLIICQCRQKKKRINITNILPWGFFFFKRSLSKLGTDLCITFRGLPLTSSRLRSLATWTVRPHVEMYITRCLVAYLLTLNMKHRALMTTLALVHYIFLCAHAPPSANGSCLQHGCMDNIMSFPSNSDPLRITWPTLNSAQPLDRGHS